MCIVMKRNMFEEKEFSKGVEKKRNKYLYWINLYGFGIIITNTCKGLKYDISVCN